MSFQNRANFIDAQSSEKLTLAWVEGVQRLHLWTLDSGSVYKRSVPYFVVGLSEGTTALTQVFSSGAVVAGTFYFDPATSELYVQTVGSTDPQTAEEMIVTYRFFFANGPAAASWDLSDTGDQVHYEGRIQLSPKFKHKIGIEQQLISLVGNGTLKLTNNDGGLDEIFDTIIFENKSVVIYSWNRDLNFSDSKVIFRGIITNKRFRNDDVSFMVKDQLFSLEQEVPQVVFDDNDAVNDSVKGNYKRWIYGRVDGLKLQSTDQIGEGYPLAGTVAAGAASQTLTGTGTSFLSDTSPGDNLTIGTQEFGIESIESDTSLTLDGDTRFSFTLQTAIIVPEIPTTTKNRTFFVAGHACAELTTTVVNVIQLNRIVLASTEGLTPGDFVTFTTGERKQIKSIAPGSIIVLTDNIILVPAVSSTVIREPIQRIFRGNDTINTDNYTIANTTTCTVTLDSDAEFDEARLTTIGVDMTFTNGTRDVTTATSTDLRELLKPRDFIRPLDLSYTTFYEVLSVDESSLKLRTAFADPNHTGNTEGKFPDYIGDETVISADILGRTVDNTPGGTWIRTSAQAVRDLVSHAGLTLVNEASFTQGSIDSNHLVSMALPLSPGPSSTKIKTAVDLLGRSTFSAITLDNDLKIKFKVLEIQIPDTVTEIYDHDVYDWEINTSNGENILNTIIRYRHTDVNRFVGESGNNVTTYINPFVEKYVGTTKGQELDAYLYDEFSAKIMSHRLSYWNSLSRADMKITTDLRLEGVEIGDTIVINFQRLYKRFGDSASRKKALTVVGKTVNGERTQLSLSDLGNLYNRSSIITPNTAPDFSAAAEDEKLKYGYITTANGLVDDEEDTANIHLIS